MKRFATLGLLAFPLVAAAGEPVSVYPPAPRASMNQPLSAAVQAAMPTNAPPVMVGQASWGLPATPAGGCAETAPYCPQTKPYFNLLAPRGGNVGPCLDRLKQWVNFQPGPGGPGCAVAPYRVPARYYFQCSPTDGSAQAGGCATGGCATGGSGSGCGTVNLPVRKLDAGCEPAAALRPRVLYQPLATTPQAAGCAPARPRLFARLFSRFAPGCGDAWCAPADPCPAPAPYPYPTGELLPSAPGLYPAAVPPAPPLMVPPTAKPTPTVWRTPQQPFTNP